MRKKASFIALVLSVSILLCGCTSASADGVDFSSLFGKKEETVTITKSEYERLKKYEELDTIYQVLDLYYYKQPDTTSMMEYAIIGMMAALNDPYTYYYSADAWAEMWADDEGHYAGIGIQLLGNYTDTTVKITRVFNDTPAQAAGLKKGDYLKKVEDVDVTAQTMQEAVNIMRGTTGETVHIEVLRGEETLSFEISRAEINVNRVDYMMLDNHVGYIYLYEFAGDCKEAVTAALTALENDGATSIVLDLRDNPGGWVDGGCYIADLFLSEGTILYGIDRNGTVNESFTADVDVDDIPLVILVNGNSASSSELLSAALQDNHRATIVGTTSYGKGIMQALYQTDSGAGFQFTISEFFTPVTHQTIHKVGITPDVIVEMPEEMANTAFELGDMTDPQLKAAWETAQALTAPALAATAE